MQWPEHRPCSPRSHPQQHFHANLTEKFGAQGETHFEMIYIYIFKYIHTQVKHIAKMKYIALVDPMS